MTPPNGYIPVESAAIHAAGLADQPMLYWRAEWEAPQIMRWSGLGSYGNSLGWYARECKALREAMDKWRSERVRAMNNQAISFAPLGSSLAFNEASAPGNPMRINPLTGNFFP